MYTQKSPLILDSNQLSIIWAMRDRATNEKMFGVDIPLRTLCLACRNPTASESRIRDVAYSLVDLKLLAINNGKASIPKPKEITLAREIGILSEVSHERYADFCIRRADKRRYPKSKKIKWGISRNRVVNSSCGMWCISEIEIDQGWYLGIYNLFLMGFLIATNIKTIKQAKKEAERYLLGR